MTSAVAEPKSHLYPRTVFHANGVGTMVATDEEHHEKLSEQGWFDMPQEPPPPAEQPMTPEEKAAMIDSQLEGLGDQVDAQAGVVTSLEERVAKLEQVSHSPRGVTDAISSLAEGHEKAANVALLAAQRIDEGFDLIGGMQAAIAELGKHIAELRESNTNSQAAFQSLNERLAALEAKKKKE